MTKPILIAEDSEDDVALLQLTLKHAGIANPVFVVRNGSEVIAYFRGEGKYSDRRQFPLPRILFLDLKMPGLGGLDALLWLRGRPQFTRMLIVVLSAVDDWKKIKEACALGSDTFLAKPCNGEDIRNLVQYFSAFFDLPPGEPPRHPSIPSGPAVPRTPSSHRKRPD
jgi:two-component system response regulator